MANKAKGKKARSATLKAQTAKASAPSVTPIYLPEGETYTMGLHEVVRALKVIEKHGYMAKFIRVRHRPPADPP